MKFDPSLCASCIKGLVWPVLGLHPVYQLCSSLYVERGTSIRPKRMCRASQTVLPVASVQPSLRSASWVMAVGSESDCCGARAEELHPCTSTLDSVAPLSTAKASCLDPGGC